MKEFNKLKGDYGEIVARKYLRRHGYKILDTNYHTPIGEVDIVATKRFRLFSPKVIVFVEVKARSSMEFGHPREAVTEDKQYKIRQVAMGYMIEHDMYEVYGMRFDVIDIVGKRIEHIVNAF